MQSCQRAQQHDVAKERAYAQKLPAEVRAPPAVTLFVFLAFGFNRIIFKFPFWLALGGLAFCWTFIIFMLMLQWTPFGKAAQRVFPVLGLKDPSGVDLKKTTKAQRKPGDPPVMGAFFFRY